MKESFSRFLEWKLSGLMEKASLALKKIDPALGMNHCEPQRLNNINALFGWSIISLLRVVQSDRHPTNVCGAQSCCCCYKSLGGRPRYVFARLYIICIYIGIDKVERRTSAACEISRGKSERRRKMMENFRPPLNHVNCKSLPRAGHNRSYLSPTLMVMSIVNH
jgi:hypothetical protein